VVPGPSVLLGVLVRLPRLPAIAVIPLRRPAATTAGVRRVHRPVRPHRAVDLLRRPLVLLLRRRAYSGGLRTSRLCAWRVLGASLL
jgi:hypothetical protein